MVCPYCAGRGCDRCRGAMRSGCPYCKGRGCNRCMNASMRKVGEKSCNCNRQRYWFLIVIILALLGYIFFTRV